MKCIFCKKEQKKPKFKIWDYVVEPAKYNNLWNDEFLKIFSCMEIDGKYVYNVDYWKHWYAIWLVEKELREPTEEELDLYFR